MEIRIGNLRKDYFSDGKRIAALSDVSVTIPANQIFTLLGPSGCGKTTLLRCIVGLEVPDAGEIAIGDEIVCSRARNIFVPPERRGLNMVFQSYAIWPHLSVFENVAYPLQVRGVSKPEIRRRVEETLTLVQLAGLGGRAATRLSGGQQQRVALARALVAEPKVILFDEPLSNLDAKLREETRKELREFLTTLKITAVYVTHDRVEALSLSDTVAVMREGRIVEMGTPRQIYFGSDRRFVADFIGRANLIEGKVSAASGGRTLVESPVGPIACRTEAGVSPGAAVAVCIRPEFIQIIDEDPGGRPNVFRGRVESLVFVGEACEGEIRIGDTLLIARLAATAGVKAGDEVLLHADPAHCMILSE